MPSCWGRRRVLSGGTKGKTEAVCRGGSASWIFGEEGKDGKTVAMPSHAPRPRSSSTCRPCVCVFKQIYFSSLVKTAKTPRCKVIFLAQFLYSGNVQTRSLLIIWLHMCWVPPQNTLSSAWRGPLSATTMEKCSDLIFCDFFFFFQLWCVKIDVLCCRP